MANDKAEFWTTEQVAAHLGLTVKDIYESARANRFPGNLGTQRGRRKLYRSDLILAGPQEPKTTSDPVEAILWTVQGIEAKLAAILAELKAQRPQYLTGELLTVEQIFTTTIETEEEE